MKIAQAKAPENNVYLTKSDSRVSGNYVAMRAPRSRTKLIMLEFNSEAANQIKEIDEESSWLGTLIKPIILLVFMGGTCYISWSTVRKKNAERRAGGGGGGNPFGNKFGAGGRGAAKSGGSKGLGGGGFGGRKRR